MSHVNSWEKADFDANQMLQDDTVLKDSLRNHYLETYLLPLSNSDGPTPSHVFNSMLLLLSEHELPPWHQVGALLDHCLTTSFVSSLQAPRLVLAFVNMLTGAFSSLSVTQLRQRLLRLVHVPLWTNLIESKRERELTDGPRALKKQWRQYQRKKGQGATFDNEEQFIPAVIELWLKMCEACDPSAASFVELFTMLMGQLPTRRFVRTLLIDHNVLPIVQMSKIHSEDGHFRRLVSFFKFYLMFPVNDHTAVPLSDSESWALFASHFKMFQVHSFANIPSLRQIALGSTYRAGNKDELTKLLDAKVSDEELWSLCDALGIRHDSENRKLALASLMFFLEPPSPVYHQVQSSPLYPTERMFWNNSILPLENDDRPFPLPKAGLQYLSPQDYFLRHYTIYRLETAFDLAQYLVIAATRMQPQRLANQAIQFQGWARVALPVRSFKFTHIGEPNVGEQVPSVVRAEVWIDLKNFKDRARQEWESVGVSDVLYLLELVEPQANSTSEGRRAGIQKVRGCKVIEMRDEKGEYMHSLDKHPIGGRKGTARRLLVELDPGQYTSDKASNLPTFTAIVRRNARENTFSKVLETVREMLKADGGAKLPAWIQDTFLGYGHGVAEVAEPQPIDFSHPTAVEFTEPQKAAINHAVTTRGLTLVEGPPGSGKTDTCAQIMALLYRNFPSQRILVIAHSNTALDHIFEKVLALPGVDDSYFVRLGLGGKDTPFSREGRVAALLKRREECLASVLELAKQIYGEDINTAHAVASSCDTARYFFDKTVKPALQKDPTLFKEDAATIHTLFETLSECSPLEVMRGERERADFIVSRHSRVVAMTATHAGMSRDRLLQIDFSYDALVVEESAQMMELEAVIPMVLQRNTDKLKRIVLIGDRHQLPPVVHCRQLIKKTNIDRSLFARLVDLGIPSFILTAQGRCRESLAPLFSWRYPGLTNLPRVQQYAMNANAGLCFDFQFVNVGPFNGTGENSPSPFNYQNLGEAEYMVATYVYLRALGHPQNSFALLAAYKSQCTLLREVCKKKCGSTGIPKICTVDKFQGQQAPIVLLSLVRTSHAGHLQDARRMTVALSRAQLGCYVFGRVDVFKRTPALQPAMDVLLARSTQLVLVPNERYPTTRRNDESPEAVVVVRDVKHMWSVMNGQFELTAMKDAVLEAPVAPLAPPGVPLAFSVQQEAEPMDVEGVEADQESASVPMEVEIDAIAADSESKQEAMEVEEEEEEEKEEEEEEEEEEKEGDEEQINWKKTRVAQLREMLAERDLSTKGKKAVLVKRLQDDMKKRRATKTATPAGTSKKRAKKK